MSERGFTAFISYRHQSPDMDVAQRLHTAIETYRIPANIRQRTGRTKMGRVFRDQEELPLSSDLGQDIEDALDRSEWLIAVCSPRYLESRWCMRELEYFIEKKGKDHVLTILAEGEPQDSFPQALQFREDAEGNLQPVEPLAADVRAATAAESLKSRTVAADLTLRAMPGEAMTLTATDGESTVTVTGETAAAAKRIAALHPDFMSVTYGAGGGTGDYTAGIAAEIQDAFGVPTTPEIWRQNGKVAKNFTLGRGAAASSPAAGAAASSTGTASVSSSSSSEPSK